MEIGEIIHSTDDPVTWLYEDERRIIQEARIVIRGGLSDIADSSVPYINKNTSTTADLANLKSRIQYVMWMKERECGIYEVELRESGEYNYSNRDATNKAMLNDPKFADLRDFINKLDILCQYIDKLSWVLTNTLDKVKSA